MDWYRVFLISKYIENVNGVSGDSRSMQFGRSNFGKKKKKNAGFMSQQISKVGS